MVTMARLKAVTADGLTALHVAIACGQREVEQPTKWWAGNNWETSWQWDLASVWDLCFFSVAGLKVKICAFFISLNHLTTKQTFSLSLYFKRLLQLWLAKLLLLLLLWKSNLLLNSKWIVNLLIHVDPRFSAGHAAFVGKWFCLEPKGWREEDHHASCVV